MNFKNNMLIVKAAVFTIACLTTHVNGQEPETYSKVHRWPNTQIFIYSPFIDASSLTWATCDHSGSSPTKSKCAVMREVFHFNGTSQTFSCDVNLEPKHEHSSLHGDFKVILFGNDRAILISAENVQSSYKSALVKFSAVHFPSCKVVENNILFTDEFSSYSLSKFDILDHLVTVTAYDDKYDVIFKNKTLCNSKLCILSIDSEGKLVDEPHILSVDNLGDVSKMGSMPISSNSVSKGLVLTQRDEYFKKENQVMLVSANGTKILKHVKSSSGGSWISMTYDMISFCDLIQLSYHGYSYFCAQYDHQGNLQKEINLDFDDLKFIRSIHNLQKGGFLLLTSENKIVKIDSEGKKFPSAFDIENFSCEKGLSFKDAFIFEKDDKEVCVSRACSSHLTPRQIKLPEVPSLDFSIKCFAYKMLEPTIGDIKKP